MNKTPLQIARQTKRDEVPPVGVFRSAEAFLIAADQQRQWLKENSTVYSLFDAMPIYFLYGQAIELMLKAYLRAQGIGNKEVEKYGHNILKLYNKCREHFLPLDQHTLNMMGILAHHFSEADWHIQFRYISDFKEPFPALEAVSVFGRALLEAVRPICGGTQKNMDALQAFLLALQAGEIPAGTSFQF